MESSRKLPEARDQGLPVRDRSILTKMTENCFRIFETKVLVEISKAIVSNRKPKGAAAPLRFEY